MPIGTFINIAGVIIGSLIGLFLRKQMPENVKDAVFKVIGIFTITVGMSMAIKMDEPILILSSLVVGTVLGTIVDIDKRINQLTSKFTNDNKFAEGLITAFLLYCVGSMAIIGSINEGINNDSSLLLTKSVLDTFSSIALASTYGVGVLFSVIPMLIFQGGITLFAGQFKNIFSEKLVLNLTSIGGMLILGLGMNLLGITKLKIANYLLALVLLVVLILIFK